MPHGHPHDSSTPSASDGPAAQPAARIFPGMERWVHRVSRLGALLSAVGTSLIVVLVVLDVARRNLANKALPGVVEISSVTLVIVVFAGLGLAQATNSHVATTIVLGRLRGRARGVVPIVGTCAALLFAGLLFYATLPKAIDAYLSNEMQVGLLSIPTWPARAVIAVGALLLALEILITLVHQVLAAFQAGRGRDTGLGHQRTD